MTIKMAKRENEKKTVRAKKQDKEILASKQLQLQFLTKNEKK